jgi:YfiH family protein
MFHTDKNFKMPSTVRHAFFGRKGGVSKGIYESLNCAPNSADNPDHVVQNRARVAMALEIPPENLWTLHQTHSADCLIVREPFDPYFDRPKADALVTDVAGLALGALTADCAPVLFYGEKTDGSPIIGAAHAGWKGALGGVLEATIEKMIEIDAVHTSIRASVGACLARESYEIGEEFLKVFLETSKENSLFFTPSPLPSPHKGEGKSIFDFPAYILHRLENAGIQHASWIGQDTYTNESDYFSYRRSTHRNEPDYGRQISAIVIL